ncbi:hypothetical protein VTN00DRAFT_8373 [Thermoascus crustaceus]|uniref:uncharacterized protein n=1 Tax=Thermoascus crustaceus TaxID=5088 RepID=UPI003741E96D
MRVLCLHGKGTSGAIFKSQTASFRGLLQGQGIEFEFVDGPHASLPAPGIDLFYPPPFYAFWNGDSLDEIHAARDWLADLVSRSGPYDAVMTFSQGCALAATALLHHQAQSDPSSSPPPFKAAIFICGGAPLTVAESLGFTVSQEAWDRDAASRKALSDKASAPAILAQGSKRWTDVDGASGYSVEDASREVSGPLQIKIPTVHIYGSKDPRYFAGVQLSSFCDPRTRKVYNHGGGHEIPRGDTVSRTIADLVRWALVAGKSGKDRLG